jgi:hypothetical protein
MTGVAESVTAKFAAPARPVHRSPGAAAFEPEASDGT